MMGSWMGRRAFVTVMRSVRVRAFVIRATGAITKIARGSISTEPCTSSLGRLQETERRARDERLGGLHKGSNGLDQNKENSVDLHGY